ncbi:MAG TPA: TIR domain-containing protein [Thermoanaerobaculia bacterium]|nr:TIR domain-containing protein [Thermoanaerobaculia bacterium]
MTNSREIDPREIDGATMVLRPPATAGQVLALAWSPDGNSLAASFEESLLVVWETRNKAKPRRLYTTSSSWTMSLDWSADGGALAAASHSGELNLFETATWNRTSSLPLGGRGLVRVAWRPGFADELAVSGENEGAALVNRQHQVLKRWRTNLPWQRGLAWSRDGRSLALGGMIGVAGSEGRRGAGDIVIFHLDSRSPLYLRGDLGEVLALAYSPTADLLASGSANMLIRIWAADGRLLRELEGHTGSVHALSFSADGMTLVSKSTDDTVRLWRTDSWDTVDVMRSASTGFWPPPVACHPKAPRLALATNDNLAIHVVDIDPDLALAPPPVPAVHYVTAKLALVGDHAAGKTCLGWRLRSGEFKVWPSTHGHQFWLLPELGVRRSDGTDCEVVLWDLAGQPDYRLIHALFLDDADVVLLVFDSSNRIEPLKGVEYWLKVLARAGRQPCRKLLVAAQIDRGAPALSAEEIMAFCRQHGIARYVATSAERGDGIGDLLAELKEGIPWDDMPATVTTATFKRIKEYVLALKESEGPRRALISLAEFRTRLQALDSTWSFGDDEMSTAIGHLAKHGFVSLLRRSSGERSVLLAPELLNNLAASLILKARANPKGLGALEEERARRGGYPFAELAGLAADEQETLLDSAMVLFLDHNLCFRESVGESTLLVFPALINLKKPVLDQTPTTEEVSYKVTGAVENVYAALVVLLGYTNTFTRTNQWQNEARYEVDTGEVCGFRLAAEREGEIDLVLYYGAGVPEHTRLLFQGLFERILARQQVGATRFAPVVCPRCGYRPAREEAVRQILSGKPAFCGGCGKKMTLPLATEAIVLSRPVERRLDDEQRRTRQQTAFEKAITWLKRQVGEQAPTCFISYALGVKEHERWVERALATDLKKSGIDVILDRWHNAEISASVGRFVSRMAESRFILAVGSPLYQEKYENQVAPDGSVLAAEVDQIYVRMTGTEEQKRSVLPLLLAGSPAEALPPLLRGRVYADFRRGEAYFPALFDLILTLHGIPFESEAVIDLRQSLLADLQAAGLRAG